VNLKQNDKVRIKANSKRKGWIKEMEPYVGEKGIVTDVKVVVAFSNGKFYWFDENDLEKIKEEK